MRPTACSESTPCTYKLLYTSSGLRSSGGVRQPYGSTPCVPAAFPLHLACIRHRCTPALSCIRYRCMPALCRRTCSTTCKTSCLPHTCCTLPPQPPSTQLNHSWSHAKSSSCMHSLHASLYTIRSSLTPPRSSLHSLPSSLQHTHSHTHSARFLRCCLISVHAYGRPCIRMLTCMQDDSVPPPPHQPPPSIARFTCSLRAPRTRGTRPCSPQSPPSRRPAAARGTPQTAPPPRAV